MLSPEINTHVLPRQTQASSVTESAPGKLESLPVRQRPIPRKRKRSLESIGRCKKSKDINATTYIGPQRSTFSETSSSSNNSMDIEQESKNSAVAGERSAPSSDQSPLLSPPPTRPLPPPPLLGEGTPLWDETTESWARNQDGPRPLDASLRVLDPDRNYMREVEEDMEASAADVVPAPGEDLAGPYIWPEPNFI